jgi:hypothetical protein
MKEERTTDCGADNDKRILMRKILNGEISEKKLEKYLSELPDVSSCAEEIIIE